MVRFVARRNVSGHRPVPGVSATPAVLDADKNPQNQAKALYYPGCANATRPGRRVSRIMNWYEALYYGLNAASLQNAAGQFVAPSEASIDAALNDATTNADGTLTFDYTDTSDTAAYPEPVVFYAAVSTTPRLRHRQPPSRRFSTTS